jgi:hypothetical protein
MKILESSIARLMLAAATVAAALATMMSQSEFGLGVTATLVAVWLVMGLGEVGHRRGRGRPFWAAFLIVAAGSLAWSFGPWSDASIRGTPPAEPDELEWAGQLLPSTKLAFRMMNFALLQERAEIMTYDSAGEMVNRIVIVGRPDGWPSTEEQSRELHRSVVEHLAFLPSPGPGRSSRASRTFPDFAIAMHAGHLLVAVAAGWLAGMAAALLSLAGRRRRAPSSSLAVEAPGAPAVRHAQASPVWLAPSHTQENLSAAP